MIEKGKVYILKRDSSNPFKQSIPRVRVNDVKNNWVNYGYVFEGYKTEYDCSHTVEEFTILFYEE